jgi:S-adenosylmethionine hydrolase
MGDRLITLTTDFGEGSSYVAAMKGALYSVNPAARIVDLTHAIPPQDVMAAALFLEDVVPLFPGGTIHVVVVDPGVGTNRALLCVEWAGHVILAPDNGCWTEIGLPGEGLVRRLTESRYWRRDISATFHGRDILAPAAGHISLGLDPAALGPALNLGWEGCVTLDVPKPVRSGNTIRGQVVHVDAFGNLICNIRPGQSMSPQTATIAGRTASRFVKTYGDAEPGSLVALKGSSGRVEFAIVNGSAAAVLGVGVGVAVEVAAAG